MEVTKGKISFFGGIQDSSTFLRWGVNKKELLILTMGKIVLGEKHFREILYYIFFTVQVQKDMWWFNK